MELRVREWRFSNGIFGHVPAGPGPFGAVVVLHGPYEAAPGWCNRDALMFAAHGLVGLPVYDTPAAALPAVRDAPFVSGRVGVFAVGAGVALLPELLAAGPVDAIALHGAAPCAAESVVSQGVPLFLSHGGADEFFPVETSQALERAQLARGGLVEAHYYAGMDHGLNDQDAANANTARWLGFLWRHLHHPVRPSAS